MKRTLPVFALAALAVSLAACNSDSTGSGPSLTALDVQPSPVFIGVGDTTHLTATGTSTAGTTTTPTPQYTSSNPAVASVSNGTVRGVGVGTANIVASAGGLTDTVSVTVLSAGSFKSFNVNANDGCTNPQTHAARIVAQSAHAIIYEDASNPAGGFTAAEYQDIINEFENVVWPTDTQNFGLPTDIDNNGHVNILYTRAVNELTPAGANFIIGGFFYSRDLFPKTNTATAQACPTSNFGEMFYMLAPDPNGTINGHKRSHDDIRTMTVGTLGHEFQHLINASRRMYVNNANDFEEVYLDEGLAHIAEELNFYTASGLGPRANIGQTELLATQQRVDAFNEFQIANYGRLEEYLADPAGNAPFADNDDLATRGATWSFLRYAADRKGAGDQATFSALVNSKVTGLSNLTAVLGADPMLWARDWAVANYTDDAGFAVGAQFTHPSWNFRDVYSNRAFGGYPLAVDTVTNGGLSLSIKSGSAAYLKVGVAAGQQGDVRLAQQGGAVPGGACTAVSSTLGAVQQLTLGTGLALCLPGGAAGATYAVIPFHYSAQIDTTIGLSVTAANVVTPTGAPNPNRISADRAPLFSLDGYSLSRPWDGGFEQRLRARERALRVLVTRFNKSAARYDVSGQAGGSTVYVNVVRVK